MKRRIFLQYLQQHDCYLIREGGNHSWWGNPTKNRRSSVPRTPKSMIFSPKRFVRIWTFPNQPKHKVHRTPETRQPPETVGGGLRLVAYASESAPTLPFFNLPARGRLFYSSRAKDSMSTQRIAARCRLVSFAGSPMSSISSRSPSGTVPKRISSASTISCCLEAMRPS